jgi:methane/ammonia monooxygenase subunit A
VLLFLLSVWIVRYHSWEALAHFPLSLVVPATCLVGAILLDAILVLTRSWLVTGAVGGVLFGLMFLPSNWVYFAPYFQPVEHMGQMTSLADLIGYTFPRAGTPEYIRIIERGTLRTFEDSANWVSAFFSGFLCVFTYFTFWWIGNAACSIKYVPIGIKFKEAFGANTTAKKVAV